MIINERLKKYGESEENTRFANYLREVGNGTLQVHSDLGADLIQIPDLNTFQSENLTDFIDWVYPTLTLDGSIKSTSCIISPLNKDVDIINTICLSKISKSRKSINKYFTLQSVDSIVAQENDNEMALFQEEFLNSIDIAGMPLHNLNISPKGFMQTLLNHKITII